MSKQLRSKPLSQAKIQSILSQNPSTKAVQTSFPAATTPSLVSQTIVPQLITLRRKQEYDSLKPEETLKEFLKFARSVISRYEDDQKLQADLEQETQDLLHYMELSDNMNACMGNEMYKKMREIRRQRRDCKHEIELLKPLYDYLSDQTVIQQLSKIQGQCRTSKDAIALRSYTLRTDVVE